MKKLYFAAAMLLAAGAASADSLVFVNGDTPLENGSNLELKLETEYYEETQDYDVKCEPKLYLQPDYKTGQIVVKAVCTTGQEIQLCFGGLNPGEPAGCMDGVELTQYCPEASVEAGTKMNLMFHFTQSEVTTIPEKVVTLFSAEDQSNPAASSTITVTMTGDGSGIEVVETGKHVAVANGNLAYVTDAPTALNVYAVNGTRVLAATVNGAGTLSTAALAPGLYIYTMGAETGKFIVR